MGLFSLIGSAIGGVCSFVGGICSGLGGLGGAITSFISKIGVAFPGLNITSAISKFVDIVCPLAEVLGLKEKGKDEPDELFLKTKNDDKKPEDYDSVDAYIKHLQQDIQLTKEEKEKLNNMSAEERTAYRASGTYLYAKDCGEKLGVDTTGLNNELVGLTEKVLADLSKAQLSPSEFVAYNKYLQANGIGLKEFSDYLHNKSADLATDEKTQSAIVDAMKDLSPDISDDAINQKLYGMNIED